MIEFSTVQIIPSASTGRANPGEGRDLVVADAASFARRPLFAHSGNAHFASTGAGARPTVSAPFLAQHLHQEWIHRAAPADSRLAANAYARAAHAPLPRADFATAA